MIRTQISLAASDYEAAKAEARRQGISVAEFVRRAIRDHLPADESKPWMRFAGTVETGDWESSRSVDDMVYGAED